MLRTLSALIGLFSVWMLNSTPALAQTDMDALMMEKNNLCIGPMFSYNRWNQYWEGTKLRENANIGTIFTRTYSVMGNYGVAKNLNLLFNLNYVSTSASAGVLHGMRGIQDGSLFLKYLAVEKQIGQTLWSVYPIVAYSFPVGNYSPDFLPLSIGLRSRTGTGRLTVDMAYRSLFVTASASYHYRGNVTLDRESYYTTRLIHSNQVEMPNAMQYHARAGLRTPKFIAEAVFNRWACLSGFDISRNNMPFVSNRMEMSSLGLNGKYNFGKAEGLSLTGGIQQVVTGRNAGRSQMMNLGVFYIIRAKNPFF
jgi:hypothetical protein